MKMETSEIISIVALTGTLLSLSVGVIALVFQYYMYKNGPNGENEEVSTEAAFKNLDSF